MVGRWSASPLCPACHAIAGAALPVPVPRREGPALWLWTSDTAQAALATGDLAVIIRTYRAATGVSQRRLAELLGYDPTYISMIETGRREISDVTARLRIARHLGLPAHRLGVSDPDDADFTAMLQFGESTIRLAAIARQSGHGADAVNELWPLVTRLESRVADGHVEREVMLLLARARAELGVSLGYVLPEERLVSAARWTGRALRLAEHLNDQDLLAFTLRVHGNELRKVERPTAAVARPRRSAELARDPDRGAALVQLARAAGELGDPALFDHAITSAWRLVDATPGAGLTSPYALHEVHLRGLVHTRRPELATDLLNRHRMSTTATPPQWQAILHVTTGEVRLAHADTSQAEAAFQAAITIAEEHRLPHQIQRSLRACTSHLPAVGELARQALQRLRIPQPNPAGTP
ncbi:helix-turn-helix domain-containing protein [Micromonospora chalcea]|uniref:helix-turn-helix domain-containing protein n=1 Tax=Micromonospora chalcea TaxID=1874 RepID=UPI0033BFF15C